MWMQVVGKVKLALSPFLNQWWQIAFQLTPVGLTTGRIPYKDEVFGIDFDFITHTLIIRTSKGKIETIALRPCPVADFYKEFMKALRALNVEVIINPIPVEFTHPIPFAKDRQHFSYDKEYVGRWWQTQLSIGSVFDRFRTPFRGKK